MKLRWLVGLLLLPVVIAGAQTTNEFESARKLFQAGQWPEALTAFQKFEAANPFSAVTPDAINYEGWCCFNLHRYEEAAGRFERILRDYPTAAVAPEAMLKKAECERARKQFDPAAQLYRDFQTKYPQHALIAQAMLGEAATQFEAQDYAGAKTALRTLRERFPDDLGALLLFGQVLTEEKQYEEAVQVYRDLLGRRPNDQIAEQASFSLIQTLTQRGELAAVSAETEAFKKRFPKSQLLENAALIQAEALFGQQNYRDALALYQKSMASEVVEYRIALCYFNLEQFDQAREAFAGIPKKYPQGKLVPETWARLGQTDEEIANRSSDSAIVKPNRLEAIKAYEQIRTQPEAVFRLGYLHSYLAEYDQAIAYFQEFTQKWPSDALVPEALYQIARNQLATKRYDDAIATYRALLDKYPDHSLAPFAAFEIASAYADGKKLPEMLDALRHYVKRYPKHDKLPAASYLALGNTFLRTENFTEARAVFEKVPTPAGQLGLGQALFGLKQYDDAELVLRKVNTIEADLMLAKIDEAKGNLPEAVDLYNHVMQSGRGDMSLEATYRLGNIFFNLTDPAKSKENKQTALAYYARLLFATGPMAEEAAYRAGECHVALGNFPQACTTFQAYVKRFPSGQFAEAARSKVTRFCTAPTP